jgi:hypothetical protein
LQLHEQLAEGREGVRRTLLDVVGEFSGLANEVARALQLLFARAERAFALGQFAGDALVAAIERECLGHPHTDDLVPRERR